MTDKEIRQRLQEIHADSKECLEERQAIDQLRIYDLALYNISRELLGIKDRLSDYKLKKSMKETKSKSFWRFWKVSKFIDANYEEDKKNVIAKYNEVGYRDARIHGYLDVSRIISKITFLKSLYAPENTNGYNRHAYIVRDYLKYPLNSYIEYNAKLNAFDDEDTLILYIINNELEKQR